MRNLDLLRKKAEELNELLAEKNCAFTMKWSNQLVKTTEKINDIILDMIVTMPKPASPVLIYCGTKTLNRKEPGTRKVLGSYCIIEGSITLFEMNGKDYGQMSNNYVEYQLMLNSLNKLIELKKDKQIKLKDIPVQIFSGSKIVTNQINKANAIFGSTLQPYYNRLKERMRSFLHVEVTLIPKDEIRALLKLF